MIPDLEGDMAFTVGTSRFGWDKDPKLSVVVWHENMTDPAETDPKKAPNTAAGVGFPPMMAA